jgi:release factor glutamine methyltransferase
LGKNRLGKKIVNICQCLLKNKFPQYYAYQGRKISKKITLPNKILINEFYNKYSFDKKIVQFHNNYNLKKKISIPTNLKKINVEIGFGNGEFLIKSAIAKPDELFIGIEVYLNGIANVLKSIIDHQIQNILLSNVNSFYFLDAIQTKSIDKIFIINPDPWIKKRHHKRRLMSFKVIQLLTKVVKLKHSIYMTTDSKLYLNDILNILTKYRDLFGDFNFSILSKNDKLFGISRYQRKAIEKRRKIYLLTF